MLGAEDTIAAIASPPGCAVSGTIRLSGAASHQAVRGALVGAVGDRGAVTARFIHCSDVSVPVRVAFFHSPASYTGEDAVELALPGRPALLGRALARLLKTPDVRLAHPGEFTQRAFANGKMTIEQAEGVAAMIAACGEDELLAAQRLLRGGAGADKSRLASQCADLLAAVEAGVDFADEEDVVVIGAQTLRRELEDLRQAIGVCAGGATPMKTGCETGAMRVVLAGAPNAGKSTLFNALLGRRRAVVSERPGATRDLIEETLDLADVSPLAPSCVLVDMAGLDAVFIARGDADAQAQRQAHAALASADVVVHCDPAGVFAPLEHAAAKAPTIRARTKADLPSPPRDTHDSRDDRSEGDDNALALCALDGWRVDALKRAIADACARARGASALARVAPRHALALARSAQSVNAALEILGGAQDDSRSAPDEELIAQRLRDALAALGEISGKTPPDDVLGRIFASFCIGK